MWWIGSGKGGERSGAVPATPGVDDEQRTFFSFAFSAVSSLAALRDCFCSCLVVNCVRERPSVLAHEAIEQEVGADLELEEGFLLGAKISVVDWIELRKLSLLSRPLLILKVREGGEREGTTLLQLSTPLRRAQHSSPVSTDLTRPVSA